MKLLVVSIMILRIMSSNNKKTKKTTLIVSHRFNTLKYCDKIYMIKDKEIRLLKKSKLIKYFEN